MPPSAADPLLQLRDGEIAPLYWIHGKERYLVDRAVAIIRERALDPRTRDFNYDLLYAKEAGPDKIVGAARTMPMMAKRRLVMVRDADGLDAKALESITPYVANPAPETCLVFVAEKADMRLKFFTTFKKRGVLLKLDPLAERQLPGFVSSEARSRGLSFASGAAEWCVEEIGSDLGQLASAIERIELYLGARKQATVADVEAVVATTRQRSVFELCDAIGEADRARALKALGSLFAAARDSLRRVPRRGVVELVGVGFWDFVHNQRGGASNGFELHPVMLIVPARR